VYKTKGGICITLNNEENDNKYFLTHYSKLFKFLRKNEVVLIVR